MDKMPETPITIPENLQQICRDFAEVAQKNGLYKFSGSFTSWEHWGGDINFSWSAGRHSEDSNELKISSTFNVFTTVKIEKQNG